jgi:hypothetical protein
MTSEQKQLRHDRAISDAANEPDAFLRSELLAQAAMIAILIRGQGVKLGAGAACAWSMIQR